MTGIDLGGTTAHIIEAADAETLRDLLNDWLQEVAAWSSLKLVQLHYQVADGSYSVLILYTK
jgi:hypothetical protein